MYKLAQPTPCEQIEHFRLLYGNDIIILNDYAQPQMHTLF